MDRTGYRKYPWLGTLEATIALALLATPFALLGHFHIDLPILEWLGPYAAYQKLTGQPVGYMQYFLFLTILLFAATFTRAIDDSIYKFRNPALLSKIKYRSHSEFRLKRAIGTFLFITFVLVSVHYMAIYVLSDKRLSNADFMNILFMEHAMLVAYIWIIREVFVDLYLFATKFEDNSQALPRQQKIGDREDDGY